ncbi:MAG: lamin tail domain-containing protein, partial [Verrucomicrobiota bacterium]|nr:lamin tail domain-containing protein [Verrucomicrobiota bacterium]
SEENEFIELMNISDQAIQLTGVSFSTGIQYTFEGNATLDPMARTVLNPSDYTGQLDNGGENITLLDADGNIIESFRYNDKSPWPEAPDGNGPSLVRIAPEHRLDPELASSWRPSVQDNGNPGSSDASSFEGQGQEAIFSYALKESPFKNPKFYQITQLKDSTDFVFIASIEPNLSADDVAYSIEFSSDLKQWTEGIFLGNIHSESSGSTLSWQSKSPVTDQNPQQFARVKITIR